MPVPITPASATLAQGGWTTIQTVTSNGAGMLTLTVDQPANLPERYYRFHQP